MTSGSEIDRERLGRLEQGLQDVRTVMCVWRKCAAYENLTPADNADFSNAHNRMLELSAVLTEDVRDMTGIEAIDLGGGKIIGLFAGAVDPNPFDGTALGAPGRIHSLRQSETILTRTIGLVKAGYKPIAARRNRELKMSEFEQARQTMVEKLLELRGTTGYANPTKLAPILGRPVIDIADDAWTLKRQGYVTILEVGDQRGPEGGDRPGILDIRLTDLGVQRAKEGYQAVANQPSVQQTNNNTFLTTGGTLNVAQTGKGDVFQRIEQAPNVGEIHRLLGEMRQAIAGVDDLAETDREAGLVHVEHLLTELRQPNPRPSMLKIPWESLGRIADVAGAVQGGMIVKDLYLQLQPLVTPMLQALIG